MKQRVRTNSVDEYIHNLVNCYGFTCSNTGDAITLTAPEEMGCGYIKAMSVSDDIDIGIIDLTLLRPLVSYYDDYPNTCEATYCFSGHISYLETGITKADLNKNEMGLYALPYSRGMTMIPSNERVLAVSVVSKNDFHRQLPYSEQCAECDGAEIRNLLHALTKPRKSGAMIHNYFKRLIDNSIQQELQNTYLDSLGKVLVSDLWQEHIITPLSGRPRTTQSSFDKRALQKAGDILANRYAEPPTIAELAKIVALNEHKLKTGFRDMYGKSIYEFVRCLRMETASHLLENMDLSVSEVAGMVGYVNTSHFAAAFRGAYGQNPSDFRLRA